MICPKTTAAASLLTPACSTDVASTFRRGEELYNKSNRHRRLIPKKYTHFFLLLLLLLNYIITAPSTEKFVYCSIDSIIYYICSLFHCTFRYVIIVESNRDLPVCVSTIPDQVKIVCIFLWRRSI